MKKLLFFFLLCSCQSPTPKPTNVIVKEPKPIIKTSHAVTALRVNLAWDPNPVNQNIKCYRIYENYWNGTTTTGYRCIGVSTTGNLSVTAGYGIHTYYVTAVNSSGVESGQSNTIRKATNGL